MKLSLSKEQQKVALLRNQVDDLLSKHSEELTVKDDLIKKFSIELDSKADLVVLLTQQIYRLRAKLKQEFENAAAQSAICSCPHCHVHSKISPEARILLSTPTQGNSQVRKLAPLRKADGRHHTHSVPTSLNSQPTYSKLPPRNLVPTPPPSTPPLSASGRRRVLVKRASTPEIRTLSSSTDTQNDSPFNHESQDSYTYEITKRTSRMPRSREGNMRTRNPHEDETHHEDEKDFVTRTVYRDTPAILPPIVTPPTSDLNEEGPRNNNAAHILEVEKLSDASLLQHHHHKASYLAKFPGLSSAPPSSLRVYHRATRSKGQGPISGVAMTEEDPETLEPEGMLLVKENDEKTSDSRARWAKGTPALDSAQ